MKKLPAKLALVTAFVLLPALAYAAPANFRDFSSILIAVIKGFIRLLFVSLAIGLSYGVVLYFINGDNEQQRENIKGYLLWGVIGIVVVFGLWGILAILSATLGWGGVGIPFIRPPA